MENVIMQNCQHLGLKERALNMIKYSYKIDLFFNNSTGEI